MNAAIAAKRSSPRGSAIDRDGVRAAGPFDPWVLTEEGDGPLITLRLPLAGVEVQYGGRTRNLVADPEARVAKVLDLETSEDLPITALAPLTQALEDWLNANLHEFRHVFFRHVFGAANIVSMTEAEAKGTALAWLKPSSVSYDFGANRRFPERSILAFLCQTACRSSEGLIRQTGAEG